MNIQELDAYNLDDAVKFNDHLNPRIWEKDEHLKPEVRERLLTIAEDFKESLGIKDLDLKDITISGSNAAYTYTPNSDIDLHLVVDQPEDPVYRELFDAKKFQYNETHNITIGGADVELYVESADKPPISQGMYSVLHNKWLQVPRRVKSNVDDVSTQSKFETVGHQIERAVKQGDLAGLDRMARKVKRMRQTGLEAHGEFGPENLAFKMLRSQGVLQKLHDARAEAKSRELSLKERKKPGSVFTYGFKHEDEQINRPEITVEADVPAPTDEEILRDFIEFCTKELKIDQLPTIKLRRDPQWSVVHKTFGRYNDDTQVLEVAFGQRHIMDVLRTVAHELTHKHQHERDGSRMGPDAGETGSPWENEANAQAGVLMRDYARLHPELFDNNNDIDEGWREKAAGVAAAACIAGSPGCSSTGQMLKTTQDVGRTAQTVQKMTRAGVQDELNQELRNFIRAQGGNPNSQNLSNLYQLQKKIQKENASGYIPTKKQAKDPRYSMALTQDIRPGQVGKEANKLNLKTDRQGHPQIANANGLFEKLSLELAKFKTDPTYNVDETIQTPVNKDKDGEQYYRFIMAKHKLGRELTRQEQEYVRSYQLFKRQQVAESVEQLDEVKMSPSALQKWANSDAAKGIRAGFEAEMIFRDTTSGDDDGSDMEPDYDADERCRSIQQIIDFFNNGEYGGLTQRQEARLQEGLDEQYYEWYDEQMYKDFREEAEDLIRKVLVDEGDWDLDNEIQKQLALLDLTDDEMNDIIRAGEKAPKFTSSKEQQTYAEANPFYDQYLDAQNEAEGLLDDLVADEVRKEGANWDAALDDFRDNYQIDDDSGFFDDAGLRWMSDVANSYDLDWPYMTGGNGNGGSREWDEIGDSLQSAIDMPVKVSSNYHSTPRREGLWIVEPDSSLQPDDSEDFGLEIVSPPLPLEQALEKLEQVTDWANSPEGNCYTNSSTGLHMGVSVPFKGGDVDYLKLILFLGDEYVLQSFGREANTYTKSAMSKFRENIKGGRADPMGAIKLMQSGLLELAYREIQKGVGDGKYTSAHIQNGYIEFRSAGGDWLAEENADPEKLSSTMLRYARAMSLAANPAEERREYAKKLYKLVAPEGDSQLALFSQFAAGELTAEQLKKKWAEKTIGTEKKMNQRFRLYQNVDGVWEPVPGAEWNGYPESEVKNRVWAKYGREALDTGEYQLVNMGEQDWEVYDVNTGETLEIVKGKSKGEVADAVYDKYVDQGIGFQVRPYVDPATMTPRAKLAKNIVSKPQGPETYTYYKWNIANPKTGENDYDYMTRERVFQTTKQVEKENPRLGKYTNTIVGGGSAQLTTSNHPRDIDNMTFDFRAKGSDEVIEQQTYNPENAEKWQARPVVAAIERANELSKKLGKPVVAYEVVAQKGDWDVVYKPTGRVIDNILRVDRDQAQKLLTQVAVLHDFENADNLEIRPKMKNAQVKDVEPDVAQNFNQTNNATDRVGSWAIYDVTLGREISRMDNVPWQQASDRADKLERSTGHNMSVRGLQENFADGKNPQDKGDSVRHGIPKGATIAQLEKAAKAPGRKGQLARWQLNMRRGKKK